MNVNENFVKNALERAWIDGAEYAKTTGSTTMSGIKEYVGDAFEEIINDGSTDAKRKR